MKSETNDRFVQSMDKLAEKLMYGMLDAESFRTKAKHLVDAYAQEGSLKHGEIWRAVKPNKGGYVYFAARETLGEIRLWKLEGGTTHAALSYWVENGYTEFNKTFSA